METFIEQGTEEWLRARAGHATASRFADILGTKTARETYLDQLVCERVMGGPLPEAFSYSMKWGKDCEPYARTAFGIQSGLLVREVGFVKHPSMPWVGASADGLIGSDGGIEIKCPHSSVVHYRTWKHGMPTDHTAQVQGVMWVLDLRWIDFISFDPRMPEPKRLYVERIARDEVYIAKLAVAVKSFLTEVKLAANDFLLLEAA